MLQLSAVLPWLKCNQAHDVLHICHITQCLFSIFNDLDCHVKVIIVAIVSNLFHGKPRDDLTVLLNNLAEILSAILTLTNF